MKKKVLISAVSAVSTISVLTIVLCISIAAYLCAPRKVKRYFLFSLDNISEVRVVVPYHVESDEFPGVEVEKNKEYVLKDSDELIKDLSNVVVTPIIFKTKSFYEERCYVYFEYNNKEYCISTTYISKENKYGYRCFYYHYSKEIYSIVMNYLEENGVTN